MWKLIIEDEEGKRTIVPLTRDDYTIGRKEGNTIRLTERNVSRNHAALHRKKNGANGGTFLLEDQQSYNGVYVNGLRVAQAQDLLHGDLIQIGDYRIVLHDDAAVEHVGSTATLPDDNSATLPNITQQTRGSLLLERPNRFVMLAGPTPGAEFPLDRERLSVGRAEDATISVNHNSVSRLHCEIHALGENRFEILDKGSSNGVRVNGADLRRGIVEAGDVIELGDVRFKFVGAGQVFLPGAGESAQFESIGDRAAGDLVRQRSGSSIVPWMLMGAVVTAALVGGWVYKRQRDIHVSITPTASAAPDNGEEALLDAAAKLCDPPENDCETAHERISLGIAEHSPLRKENRFKIIEVRWAEQMLERAENEEDPVEKRALYALVERQPTVDDLHRKMASDKLQELDNELAVSANQLPVAAKDAAIGRNVSVTSAPSERGATRHERTPRNTGSNADPTARPTSAASTPATATPSTAAGASVAQQARDVMVKDPEAAKKILYPRLLSGHATKDELTLLKTICKVLRDQECSSKVRTSLGE